MVIVDASSSITFSMNGSSWVNIVSSTSFSGIIGCDCFLEEVEGRKEEGRRDEEDSTDSCVTATGGINFVRLCSIEICRLVNIGFVPRSHEYEYPISLHGRPRDYTDGKSATSLKQEYVPNSGI